MKIDLHTHSCHSKRPALWLLKRLGCPESFTEPGLLYEICKSRGMDLVTITDHNTIDGCREIAHLPGVFMSEEVTTYFPENRCKIHVLVYDHSEQIHQEIQNVRENIYHLVAYLQEHKIHHAVAHPLSSVNDRLEPEHFEKLLLLFKFVELNGDQDRKVNELLRQILASLTPGHLERLADKHNLEPTFAEPWRKTLLGGSDDHAALTLGETYTEVAGAMSLNEYFQRLAQGQGRVSLRPCTPKTMARSLYAIGYRFARKSFNLKPYVDKDELLKYLEHSLYPHARTELTLWNRIAFSLSRNRSTKPSGSDTSMLNILRFEAGRLIQQDPKLRQIIQNGVASGDDAEREWYTFVNAVANNVLTNTGQDLIDCCVKGRVFDIFSSMGRAGALYSILSPYFVSFGMHAAERELSKRIATDFIPSESAGSPDERTARIGHFTDTLYEVNGVARTLQQWARTAQKLDKSLTLITCHEAPMEELPNTRTFEPVGTYCLPEYPEMRLLFPPLLEMLSYCYDQNFTHLHAATPGPQGLAALAIARILKRPCFATYHTSLPQYADVLTDDASVTGFMWQYIAWFYEQMDVVFVNSQANADELISHGVREERLRIIPRGIDIQRFTPQRKGDLLGERFGVTTGKRLLYVGRISREKNLPLLVEAYRLILEQDPEVRLVVVGDGPYAKEMRQKCEGLPCTFTGNLPTEEVASIYPTADVFIFPSLTDTLGNVVLEAQSCGLPVLVSNVGGPQENIEDGRSGIVVPRNDPGDYAQAALTLFADPQRRRCMGQAGRRFMEERSFESAFLKMWELYEPAANIRRSTPQPLPNMTLEQLVGA